MPRTKKTAAGIGSPGRAQVRRHYAGCELNEGYLESAA
jgi:hypothetical protein